ncbi:homoserine kinase [Salana multivorans]
MRSGCTTRCGSARRPAPRRRRSTARAPGACPRGRSTSSSRPSGLGSRSWELPRWGSSSRRSTPSRTGAGSGSSAAAVVAGLVAARGFLSEPEALADDVILALATEWEGHPDNAAAAIYGGATIAWSTPVDGDDETPGPVDAARLEVDPGLVVTALVPETALATRVARSVLPPTVPHADAAFTAGRAALLTLALLGRRDLMMAATEDRLHQPYRGEVLGASVALVEWLRSAGQPAVISGAGPTVLVLGEVPAAMRETLAGQGWRPLVLPVDREGARVL